MRKPLLLTLLMLILPLLSFGTSPSTPEPSPSASESETAFAPPPQHTPGWGQVLGLDPQTAKVLDEEIALVLKEQWEAGYKAARIEYEPQVDYWMSIAQAPLPPDRFWDGVVWGAPAGAVAGATAATVVLLLLMKAVH